MSFDEFGGGTFGGNGGRILGGIRTLGFAAKNAAGGGGGGGNRIPRGGGGNGGGIIIDRSVLYCGGAEIATGVPNSASSFGILSLHRLTLAVVGRVVVVVDDDDDVDDGSAKRIRRRSFDCGTFDAVDVSSSSSLISSLSLKIGGRPGGGPGGFFVITIRCGCSITLQRRKRKESKKYITYLYLLFLFQNTSWNIMIS
jgi:hypothetical protein